MEFRRLPDTFDQATEQKIGSMGIRSRVTKDKRFNSRVIARLNCQYSFENQTYDGVIVDLSSKGAMLMSPFLPAKDKEISITVSSKSLKYPMILIGKVLRGIWVATDFGKRGRFAVRFVNIPLDILKLVSLFEQKSTY